MRSADLTATARIRDAAIEQFGQHGFGVGLRTIAEAAGVSAALVIHHFGSKDGLRKACDDYVAEEIRSSKSETMQSSDPATWFAAMAEIESYAPMMAYLVRSMQSGGELAKMLWQSMIDNAEEYMDEGVRAGTVRPSRDPHARARFLALTGGGAFLLYLQMHDNPNGSQGGAARLLPRHGAARPRGLHRRSDGRSHHVRRIPGRRRARRIPCQLTTSHPSKSTI